MSAVVKFPGHPLQRPGDSDLGERWMSLNEDDKQALRQILREELRQRNPMLVELAKEAIHEWVQAKFREFGKWSLVGLAAAGVYLVLEAAVWLMSVRG